MKVTSKNRVRPAALSVLALLLISGCGGAATTPEPSSGAIPSQAAASPADLLRQADAALKSATSYKLVADTTLAAQPVTITWNIDVAGDNYDLQSESFNLQLHEIYAGGSYYNKTKAEQPYTRQKREQATLGYSLKKSMQEILSDFGPDVAAKHPSLKEGSPATETVDGVSTAHLTMTVTNTLSPAYANSTVHYWLSTAGNPPFIRIRIDSPAAAQKQTPARPQQTTFTWSNFNQSFGIKPPADWVDAK